MSTALLGEFAYAPAMGRTTSWLRRRVWWQDLTRDWRFSRPTRFPDDIESNWHRGGKLILRRNTARQRRRTGRRVAAANAITVDCRYHGTEYAVQLSSARAEMLTDPDDWVIQFPGRTVPLTDISRRAERDAREPRVTVVSTADLAATRARRLSPDGITTATVAHSGPSSDDLRAMHHEVAAAWRQLTDVRFKLLALIPVVSGIGLFILLDDDGTIASSPAWARATAAAFGFVITLGLYIYDRRNSQLYDDLISRGKHLENAMGFSGGVFRGRLVSTSPINHGTALRIIYIATLLAWLIVFAAVVGGHIDRDPADPPAGPTETATR